MALVRARLLDGDGTSLFEARVGYSGVVDTVPAAAAEALHAAAIAVADGTMEDVRSVQRVASVQVEEREVAPLDTIQNTIEQSGGFR